MSVTWNSYPPVNSVYFSINCMRFLSSQTMVIGSSDKTLSVWDLSFSPPKNITIFKMHTNTVRCCDKLQDGTVISGGDDTYLYIWYPLNGTVLYSKVNAHSISVLCIKILSDGRIATGGADNQIRIWPTTLDSASMTLGGHTQKVLVLEQLSNGYLISGSADNYTIVWDLSGGAQKINFKPATSAVSCIKPLPDNTIAIGVADKNIYRFNMTGGKVGSILNKMSAGPCSAMMLYNSSILVVASGGLDTVVLSLTGTSFTVLRSLNLSAPNTACLDNRSEYFISSISKYLQKIGIYGQIYC
jgi:WD40 repeat protein